MVQADSGDKYPPLFFCLDRVCLFSLSLVCLFIFIFVFRLLFRSNVWCLLSFVFVFVFVFRVLCFVLCLLFLSLSFAFVFVFRLLSLVFGLWSLSSCLCLYVFLFFIFLSFVFCLCLVNTVARPFMNAITNRTLPSLPLAYLSLSKKQQVRWFKQIRIRWFGLQLVGPILLLPSIYALVLSGFCLDILSGSKQHNTTQHKMMKDSITQHNTQLAYLRNGISSPFYRMHVSLLCWNHLWCVYS